MKVTTRSSARGGTDKASPIKAAAASTIQKTKKEDSPKKKTWNDMSHLQLKRFADDDPTLTAGAKRDRAKHPHPATAELDPSGRAVCKRCGDRIEKGSLRLSLMLECHKGYRNVCTLHPDCFWKHTETKKLTSLDEIGGMEGLDQEQQDIINARFLEHLSSKRNMA